MRSTNPSRPELRGRQHECETLGQLVHAARAGRSAALVVRGEAGIGKSALLDHLDAEATDCRVLRVAGVESQLELAFAGLHALCTPLLGELSRLPAPQSEALATAFGLHRGSPPDRFLIGLAVLNLLAEAAGEQPLVCLVDDAQWLDQASADALTFAARRLAAESIVLVFAARTGETDSRWAGLPELTVGGLEETDAAALLEATVMGPLDQRVRTRILHETHGNPLALLELPRWLSATELAFGSDQADPATLTSRLELSFQRRFEQLPDQSRRLLLIAAAEPLGDVGLMWRAAERLQLGWDAASAAERSGLVELRYTVRFRHPLVRSVTYRSATPYERQQVHQALADVTDGELDPDRRAWHRARATFRPDETVASELERSAGRALAQGGLAAAAAFLERAAALTPNAAERARRELAAAEVMLHAGTFDSALRLLARAEAGALSDLQRARVDVLRAQVGFAARRGNEALPLLLAAARRLEPLDTELALDSYVDALTAALFAGRLASGVTAAEVARAARNAPMPAAPRRGDILLEGVAVQFADSYPAAVPMLRRAVEEFDTDALSIEEGVRFLWLATVVASDLWDHESWSRLADRHVRIARDSGALSALPLALNTRVFVDLFAGNLAAAAALVDEIGLVTDVAGTDLTPYGAIGLAAFRGDAEFAEPLIATSMASVTERGEGIGVSLTNWARALLCNGLGRYADALTAAREAAAYPEEMGVANWALVELVEAAARAGEPAIAAAALEQLSALTRASGTEWALGVGARSKALVEPDDRAEGCYREAIDRLGNTPVRVELARAQLLYGEWLRRAGRRVEAREQLRAAHDALAASGVGAFAARARHELAATGETVRKRAEKAPQDLTPQELHIARLATRGLTNAEIGAELFISPRTVEWHLGKVFAQLGISARSHLRDVLQAVD
ncbi:helix-turn-helix transcriptional regulator [Kribbella sp. CA-253562]|uniref:helix-turn-helix transcriptional regulator n=1 Tax=Kribbella sp. CA-253562 TaxID=3239942 RepID=UPI003D94C407